MTNKTIQFVLVSPEKVVFDEPVTQAQVSAQSGDLGILPGHVRLITPVKIAPLRLTLENGQEQKFLVHGGTLQVAPEKAELLCDNVEKIDEINADEARQAKEALEAKLRGDLKPEEVVRLHRELEIANARLEITRRHGH
jgi:F-type H+-transporting ATPase subunit epsilon